MSLDICEHSNATIRKSIHDMTKDDLQDVPDFIWASPPYQTFSYLAGGKHRSKHDFEKTSFMLKEDKVLIANDDGYGQDFLPTTADQQHTDESVPLL